MRKSLLMVTILLAALGSGVAFAKGGNGGMMGGMGGSGQGMGASNGDMYQGQNGKGAQGADDAAKKERERIRAREQQKLMNGSGNGGIAPFQNRTQEQNRIQQNLQP